MLRRPAFSETLECRTRALPLKYANQEEIKALRERAVELRLAGKSLREIKEALGPVSNNTLHDALKDTPPPDWTRRPNAKDDVRAQARELRAQGLAYHEIAARLGVSKSSVSLWVRDLPVPDRLTYEQCRKRAADGVKRYWEAERAVRRERHAAERTAANAEIGELTDREVLIAGSHAYWREGSKTKEYRRSSDRVIFMNSDPGLIRFFLRFLTAAGVASEDMVFQICIHETADVEAAQRFWLKVTSANPSQFRSPTLKRHVTKTVRKNVGDTYFGCLRVEVRRSGELYRKIEAWASAAMSVA